MDELLSSAEAAAYLGRSTSDLKYWVYVAQTLKPTKKGKTLLFRRADLDDFNRACPPGTRRNLAAKQTA